MASNVGPITWQDIAKVNQVEKDPLRKSAVILDAILGEGVQVYPDKKK